MIYRKLDVDNLNKNLQKKLNIQQIIFSTKSEPFNIFLTALKEADIIFNDTGKLTKNYWLKYIKLKLANTTASNHSIEKALRVYFNTTELLTKLTNTKEIFLYSNKELDIAVFNTEVGSTVKIEFYKFLKALNNLYKTSPGTIKFKIDSLPNLYKQRSKRTNDKTIYSIDMFINLIDYVKNVSHHKTKAIESIELCINNQNNDHYDSSWLYVLLHLNNAWRHFDVTTFPRIQLDCTRLEHLDPINALKWLTKNDLNSDEINAILNQVDQIKFFHSKTKKRRHFFCSEELTTAFVYAAVICEIHCRICTPLSNTLINFNNRKSLFKKKFQNAFFANFNSNFHFKSKQMNRTLISYIYSVIKKMTNRNPLEVTKYIRGHINEETTHIYVDIPQEQMDFITHQLFNMGHFGYAYDALNQLLTNNSSDTREERTAQAMMVKEVFGDIHQIEQLATYLTNLIEDQKSVRKVLMGYSLKEKEELFNLIRYNQQPAKKEGFQCIYNECPFPSKDCERCPFAIIHFYALSQLSEDLFVHLNEFKIKFPVTKKKGEKIRLANNLYTYLHLVSSAIKQFGAPTVATFLNKSLDDVKIELASIPSAKELVTIPYLKGGNS
ncbi:hypothetical protein [Bacillus mobilis]|nr:hypothetical protein [Bacillus mobilis]